MLVNKVSVELSCTVRAVPTKARKVAVRDDSCGEDMVLCAERIPTGARKGSGTLRRELNLEM